MTKFKRASWFARLSGVVLLGALVFASSFAPALAASQPLTGTLVGAGVGRQVAFSRNGKSLNNWAGVLKLQLDNGPEVAVFCIQLDVRVSLGDRYRSDGPVLNLPNGCQIRYLLDKYPASSAKDADEAAARQLAIWVFSDGVDPATIQDAKVRDRVIALVDEAKQGPCPNRRTEAPDLSLDPPATSAVPGQTVMYTVSAGPADAGQTVTVSVSGPAVLADANGASSGQQQQQIVLNAQGLANFWVNGTGAGQTIVKVELPYRLEAGTVFSQIDDSSPSQRLVLAESRDLAASITGQLSWAAGAPTTPTSPATSPTPPATSPTPANAPAPPTPTRRPQPAATPLPTQMLPTGHLPIPTGVIVVGTAATATPGAPTSDQAASPAPTDSQAGAGQAAPAPTATTPAQPGGDQSGQGAGGVANQGVSGQPAQGASGQGSQAPGSASAPRPRSLPRTGEGAASASGLLLVGVLALLIGGWILRRRETE